MIEHKKIRGRHKDMRIVTKAGDLRRIRPAQRCWAFPVMDDDGKVIYPPPLPKLKTQKSRLNSMGILRPEPRSFSREFPVSEGLAEEAGDAETRAAERERLTYIDYAPPVKLGDLMKRKEK